MISYYIIQNVAPGCPTSYPVGRTLLNVTAPPCKTEYQSEEICSTYNRHVTANGLHYDYLAWEECNSLPSDIRLERS